MEKPFIDLISFVRLVTMEGSADTFKGMKLYEKIEKFDKDGRPTWDINMTGTQIPTQGSKAEGKVWSTIAESFR